MALIFLYAPFEFGVFAADSELRLESDDSPAGIRLQGKTSDSQIRSVRLAGKVPVKGDGMGAIWIDRRPAELNTFGDVVQRLGPPPDAIPVELRYLVTSAGKGTNGFQPDGDSLLPAGFRLYDVVVPGGAFSGVFKLVLGTTNLGPHRLLIYSGAGAAQRRPPPSPAHILLLSGEPAIISGLPDAPLSPQIDLRAYYSAVRPRRDAVCVQGLLSGPGSLAFDPNSQGFDMFGEPTGYTLMGFPHFAITLTAAATADPLAWISTAPDLLTE